MEARSGLRISYLSAVLLISSVALVPLTYNGCGGGPHMDLGNATAELACGPDAGHPVEAMNDMAVTYEEDVRPTIFQRVCAECHGRIAGLPNWLDYTQAFAKRDLIRARITNKTMPPPGALINRLTDAEIQMVQAWVDGGALRSSATGGTLASGDCAPASGGTGDQESPTPELVEPLDPPPPDRPTYVEHLRPNLFQPICGSCHGVNPDLPNWLIYEEAEHRADKILQRVMDEEMPPLSTGIKLTENQKALIQKWVEIGAPEK
ncbi:MAG: cytochrome c [Bdellovibrionaceae bacterium]|nr:cytochrome c [Pseudobdellovibrionaceae bacterium]